MCLSLSWSTILVLSAWFQKTPGLDMIIPLTIPSETNNIILSFVYLKLLWFYLLAICSFLTFNNLYEAQNQNHKAYY